MPGPSPDDPGSHDEPEESGAPYPVGTDRGVRAVVAIGAVLVLAALVAVLFFVVLPGDDEDDTDKGTDQSTGTSITDDEATIGSDGSLDIPTINPSDFPTDQPTDLPSVLPTGLPSDLTQGIPTGNGTDPFSDFPTNPSDLESWYSDYLGQANP